MEQLLDLRPAFGSQEAPIRSAFRREAKLPPSSSHAARCGGHFQYSGDLIHGKPSEISQLDGPAFPRIELFECGEATVEGYDVSGCARADNSPLLPAAL